MTRPPLIPAAQVVGRRGPAGADGADGLPGVNAVPADTAVGAYVGTDGTNSANAVDARINGRLPFTTPALHGASSDPTVDSRAGIQAAIDACKAAGGGTVIIDKRYGWKGTLIHRGGVHVIGNGVRRVLVTDDHLDRGLVALDATAVYQYGAWGSGSVDDNPGKVDGLNIDGAGVGGATTALFQMQCVDGAVIDSRIVGSAGNAVEVGGSQNSSFDRTLIGYSAGRAIDFYNAGGQGAGQVKFNNCYVSDCRTLVYADGDPTQFGMAHDVTFHQCLFENHATGDDIIEIKAGDFRFRGCVFTNSNSGAIPNNAVVKISQDTYPTIGTTVAFDGCWWNGGAATTKPTAAVWIKSATGGVGNVVRFFGHNNVTNVQAFIAVEGATVASDIAFMGTRYLGSGVAMYSTAPGGSIFGVLNKVQSPTRWSMPDDPSGGLHAPIMFRRDSDTQDRFSADRDGTHYWFDGASTTVRASMARNATDNAMDLGGIWRVQNGVAYRGIVLANVTTAGQAVAASGAASASPFQVIQFALNGASANVTISGGVAGSQLQLMLDATAMPSGGSASITWPSNIKFPTTAPQPVQGQAILLSLVQYAGNWYEISRSGVTSGGGGSSEPAITPGTTSQYWRGDKTWQTLDKTAVGLGNVTNVAQQPAFIPLTTPTVIGTAAKVITQPGYTPAAGDIVLLTVTNGNTATAPTLNINGGGAVSVYMAGAVADSNQVFTGANGLWLLRYSGSRWDMIAPVFNYTLPSTAEAQAGVANSVRWWTSALIAAAIKAQTAILTATSQTSSYTLALTDAGQLLEMNVASPATVTVTVPANATVAFPVGTVLEIHQYGTGQVTIAPASGVTIRTPSSYTTRAQYSTIRLRKRATDEWVLSGDAT
ncbi:MAG TPA: hypothetical protein VN088_13815 [Nocardioides sp.]|nr:hypothetical protein [Nocardioides sp.]